MKMRQYTIDNVTDTARRYRTAVRRVWGFQRGEFDIDGKTILASKRTPPGQSMKKKKKNDNTS